MKNIYEKMNAKLFNQLKQLIDNKPIHYGTALRSKKYKELYDWISEVTPKLKAQEYKIQTKIYWILNGLTTFPHCENKDCSNTFEHKNVQNVRLGYLRFCSSKCSNTDELHNERIATTRQHHIEEDPQFQLNITKKIKKTKKERYGDENYTNRDKASKTVMERYGAKSYVETDIFKEQYTETSLEHFGVDHPWKAQSVRDKCKQTTFELYGDENYRNPEKAKQTSLEKYGVDNPAKAQSTKDKAKQTFMEHYGVDNNMKSPDGYKVWQDAIMKKYGKDHNWKVESVIQHTQQTNLEKYGTPHPPSYKYIYDDKSFDSSWEVAYYIWLTDMNIPFTFRPTPLIYHDQNGKKHYYEPDFMINTTGQLVEIKGPQFIDKETGSLKTAFSDNNAARDNSKQLCMQDNNVIMLSTDELQPIFNYIKTKYGNMKYLYQFRTK